MRISKFDYKEYQKWYEGRTTSAPLKIIEYDYKGGRLCVKPTSYKRAVDAEVFYNGIYYVKTFDIPCDIVWREHRCGGLFRSTVKYEKEYNWRDIETTKLAEEFARCMLEGLDALSKKEYITIAPTILPLTE